MLWRTHTQAARSFLACTRILNAYFSDFKGIYSIVHSCYCTNDGDGRAASPVNSFAFTEGKVVTASTSTSISLVPCSPTSAQSVQFRALFMTPSIKVAKPNRDGSSGKIKKCSQAVCFYERATNVHEDLIKILKWGFLPEKRRFSNFQTDD